MIYVEPEGRPKEMSLWDILTLLFDSLVGDIKAGPSPLPADAKMQPPSQVRAQGLNFEQFNVTCEDGYILDLWHVWSPNCSSLKTPVFFQHGLIDIAGTWFFSPPDKSAASILAHNCSDVWLGNSRGTVNSFLHTNLTVNDAEYWDFSFHEMAKYDVPANIDFILEKTK